MSVYRESRGYQGVVDADSPIKLKPRFPMSDYVAVVNVSHEPYARPDGLLNEYREWQLQNFKAQFQDDRNWGIQSEMFDLNEELRRLDPDFNPKPFFIVKPGVSFPDAHAGRAMGVFVEVVALSVRANGQITAPFLRNLGIAEKEIPDLVEAARKKWGGDVRPFTLIGLKFVNQGPNFSPNIKADTSSFLPQPTRQLMNSDFRRGDTSSLYADGVEVVETIEPDRQLSSAELDLVDRLPKGVEPGWFNLEPDASPWNFKWMNRREWDMESTIFGTADMADSSEHYVLVQVGWA